MPREPSKVDGSEMEGRSMVFLVQQICIALCSELSLFWLAKRFPDARGIYAREKRRV